LREPQFFIDFNSAGARIESFLNMTMFILAKATLEGKPIRLFNHENMQRDFTCIEDVAQAIVRLIDHPPEPNPAWSCPRPDPATSAAPWKICNIGNNRPEELIYMVSVLEKEFGRNAVKEMLPMQPGDVRAAYIEELTRDIGFRPATAIEDGIARFAKWFREYHKPDGG
jgi:UDP-glucuronate 4-epimerase